MVVRKWENAGVRIQTGNLGSELLRAINTTQPPAATQIQDTGAFLKRVFFQVVHHQTGASPEFIAVQAGVARLSAQTAHIRVSILANRQAKQAPSVITGGHTRCHLLSTTSKGAAKESNACQKPASVTPNPRRFSWLNYF
jgi:uncharacterized protein (DUF849 family)